MTSVAKNNSLTKSSLVKSVMDLGAVTYSPERQKIKIVHPLYDISLIDQRSQKWNEYIEKRLLKDSQAPYKNELKPQLSKCPERPKFQSKTLNIRGGLDRNFSQSTEFLTYKTAVDCNRFNINPKQETALNVELARSQMYKNMNANLVDKSTPNYLPGCKVDELISAYGVDFNGNYQNYDDDTV